MRSTWPCLLVLLLAAPAGADVLVTTTGEHIETQGAWTVKGRVVVFTTAAGALSSMRLSEIDMEASTAATEAALHPAPAPPPEAAAPPKEPVMVLTMADVKRAKPAGSAWEELGLANLSLQDLDDATLGKVVKVMDQIGEEIKAIAAKWNLESGNGLERAAEEFHALARSLEGRGHLEQGEVKAVYMAMSVALEEWAKKAETNPQEVMREIRALRDKERRR